jgi:dTDP-6-deoxy-L-talose 4-dehydrogenase (NAD+)
MKILVTGSNGYLGQGIVKVILDSGNEVVATDFKDTNIDTRAWGDSSKIDKIMGNKTL